jgi:hypothetical protein
MSYADREGMGQVLIKPCTGRATVEVLASPVDAKPLNLVSVDPEKKYLKEVKKYGMCYVTDQQAAAAGSGSD